LSSAAVKEKRLRASALLQEAVKDELWRLYLEEGTYMNDGWEPDEPASDDPAQAQPPADRPTGR
jgi:hypothetical protein